ncbi:GOLPH3/VPS74 family protein [Arthrobacter sp. Hor0625]|uniref:GOLPH3/VPS74 family protein n=1 Tax=Arthrobacter sp. Hor0625 TaxID=3457358 RepID=UPI00403EF16D
MDAETPQTPELSLPQAFLLLATNDKDGKPEVPVFVLRTTVAGAVLAELELAGAITLQGKHVRAAGAAPPADCQHELDLIRGKSRPHTPKRWVAMLEGRALVQRIYETMASRGIVEQVGERHLGLFRSTRYPEKDHGPEAALLQQLEAALRVVLPGGAAGAAAPAVPTPAAPGAADAGVPAETPGAATAGTAAGSNARTTALIALLHAAGRLGKLFPAADRVRADELAKDYWPARAVEDELRLIRLAQEEAATL